MTYPVLRTDDRWWLQIGESAVPVDTDATTTRELIEDRAAVEAARSSGAAPVPVTDLELRSPVTRARVVAQMTNYRSHAADAGFDPDAVPVSFFRKASGSISGPHDGVIRPPHVGLLDYEVELGLVIGRDVPVGTELTEADLPDVVGGLAITNDVSARDLQLPKTQFYEAKSYPTFTPVGPALVLLEPGELDRLPELVLRLWVNGDLRQDMAADDMIHTPLDALRVLSGFQELSTGDLLLTGTPVGTALSAPPKPIEIIGSLLPAALKWKAFFRGQARNPKYLRDGDVMELSIATPDGAIDLGLQRTTVRWSR